MPLLSRALLQFLSIFLGVPPRRKNRVNKEDFFISCFKKSSIIGDDGAVIGELVFSQDAFFENVHFKREWLSLGQIARKAMLVNISDAIAMNATPLYALLTVAIPPSLSRKELMELAEGFILAADEFGITIIGGDTIANVKLDISITIISVTKRPVFRTGIKPGDMIAYTGDLGSCKRDLERLQRGKKIAKDSKFVTPKLRADFFYKAAPCVSAAMDISDGLFHDLEKLSRANRIGFEFFAPIPKRIGCSGEEYEMLFAFSPKYESKIRSIARQTRTKITVFAKAKRVSYRNICKPHHF